MLVIRRQGSPETCWRLCATLGLNPYADMHDRWWNLSGQEGYLNPAAYQVLQHCISTLIGALGLSIPGDPLSLKGCPIEKLVNAGDPS